MRLKNAFHSLKLQIIKFWSNYFMFWTTPTIPMKDSFTNNTWWVMTSYSKTDAQFGWFVSRGVSTVFWLVGLSHVVCVLCSDWSVCVTWCVYFTAAFNVQLTFNQSQAFNQITWPAVNQSQAFNHIMWLALNQPQAFNHIMWPALTWPALDQSRLCFQDEHDLLYPLQRESGLEADRRCLAEHTLPQI